MLNVSSDQKQVFVRSTDGISLLTGSEEKCLTCAQMPRTKKDVLFRRRFVQAHL